MATTRRNFLRTTGAGVLATTALGATQSFNANGALRDQNGKDKPTLIVVYLRGGADPLGTIVPYTDKYLPEVRPNLHIPGPKSGSSNRVLPLDDLFGFNPNMKALHKLYKQKMCAPIVSVGSPHPTRSHFDAQDFMERAAPGLRSVNKGWLNRYLNETSSKDDANLRAFSLQPLLPRSMRGDFSVLARPDQKADLAMAMYSHLYPDNKSMRLRKDANEGAQTQKMIRNFGTRTIQQLSELNEVLEKASPSKAPYPETRFGRQMRDIATTIKANRGLEVTALDYMGWDHHIDEGPIDGQLGKALGDASDSIGALTTDLGPKRMKNVLVLVMSEFGRTVRENGNKGSDHGHGGFMIAVGGSVNGGKVYGKWTDLEKDKLYEQRDLRVHTDFRLVFAETLLDLYGFDGMKLGMFPEYKPDSGPLDFLKAV